MQRTFSSPTEISSKRPVTRRRQVVEVKTPVSAFCYYPGWQSTSHINQEPRDPRFLTVAGEFSAEKYQNNYGFLAESQRNELNALKAELKRARKMMSSTPRDQRDERESEVKRLELAVKRMESLVNRDRQDKIQVEALRKATKDEREKQKQGKQGWWMKNGTLS
jgi:ribosomal RNA-processing protein 36